MRAHLIAARYLRRVTVHWDDEVDAIIAGDAAAGLASVTPARGVVVVPMAPLGLRDRDAGTVTVTSSLGLPKKLDRIRRNPSVALAYHAREHGDSDSPLYVLVQGTATVQERPNRAWLESITPQWEHFLGPRHGGTVGRLMDIYYWQRLAITVQVRRVIVYDGTAAPRVFGEDLPDDPPAAQRPPKLGTHPRVDTAKVAARGPPAATHAAGMGPHRRAADGGSGPFHGRQRAGPEPGHQRRTPAPGRPPGGSDRPPSTSTWSARNNACTPAAGGGRLRGDLRATHQVRPRAPPLADPHDARLRRRNATRLPQGPPARPHPLAATKAPNNSRQSAMVPDPSWVRCQLPRGRCRARPAPRLSAGPRR